MPAASLLAGKYEIERELGAGGMGRVLLARHVGLNKAVAVKMLHTELAKDRQLVERFTLEARAAASLRSRHVVQVVDIDIAETGEPFLVMERLSGTDLGSKVEREGPLPVADALTYVREACEALAEAHAAGIIHRDVKPENLFLCDAEGRGAPFVKVLDFGIAKVLPGGLVPPAETRLTAKSEVVGSPAFMSPEQLGGDVDHRTDIWSLGVTLYTLLAGEPPFTAQGLLALRVEILRGIVVPLESRRRDVPPRVIAIVRRCLAVDRDERFPDARALAAELDAARAELAARTPDVVVRVPPDRASGGHAETLMEPPPSSAASQVAVTSRPPTWILFATVAIVLASLSVVFAVRRTATSEAAVTPPVATPAVAAPTVAAPLRAPEVKPATEAKPEMTVSATPPKSAPPRRAPVVAAPSAPPVARPAPTEAEDDPFPAMRK